MLGGVGWLTEQVQNYGYRDIRHQLRLEKIMSRFSVADLSTGFPSVFTSKHELKAFYSLMNHPLTTHSQLFSCFRQKLPLEQEKRYFVIQDTTSLNFSTQLQKEGMGYLTELSQRGLFLHNSLLLSEQGLPLGMVDQQVIIRHDKDYGKRHKRAAREFEQKESYKWAQALKTAAELSRQHQCHFTHLMDREADVLGVLRMAWQQGQHFIIRARHNRSLPAADEQVYKLREHLQKVEPVKVKLELPCGHGKKKVHECELRWQGFELEGRILWVVQLGSLTEPDVEWVLLTDLPVVTQEQALRVLDHYKRRWLVEELHKGLKAGCKVERRQFTCLPATLNSLALLTIVAVWLLRIKLQGQSEPEEDMRQTLTQQEEQVLRVLAKEYLRPMQKQKLREFSAKWLAVLLGNMGGFVGNQDRQMPGWQTLWLGYTRYKAFLSAFTEGIKATIPMG